MSFRPGLLLHLFLRESTRALLRHKVRSALAALGIMVGISAVALIVAVGSAGTARAEAQLRALGDNLVWIEAGARNVNGVRSGTHGMNTLTLDDAEAIAREVKTITRISPQVDGQVQILSQRRNWNARWRGESADYLDIKQYRIALGRMFTDDELKQSSGKIVLGETVRQQLFGGDDPTGEIVRINGQVFDVVGVLAPKGQSGDGRDQDDFVLLPYTTAMARLRPRNETWLDDILCSAASQESVNGTIDEVTALLRDRHRIRPGDADDFNIRRPDEIIKAQIDASRALALLLVCVASISLLVGGIGVMNVMLASAAQRTKEIGVRLAFGARQVEIQIQFLGEAVVLSLLGGISGVALTASGSVVFEKLLGWPIVLSPQAVALAVLAAAGEGIFFGFYPAWRAARMDPIAALRSE